MEKGILNQDIVLTLYEGHYDLGVAALINSLVSSDFKGKIIVGYKGNLPNWLKQLKNDNNSYLVNSDIILNFELVDTDYHFGYYKPVFLKNVLNSHPSAMRVYYFDPDIVVNAPWVFFKEWVECGVGFCLDEAFQFVHENHPWRNKWLKLAKSDRVQKLDFYVNSGFIGLQKSESLILDRWIALTESYEKQGGNIKGWQQDGYLSFKGDQDLLNAALTVSPDIPISVIGNEGMGFRHPAYLMTHACTKIKPWKKNFLKDLVVYGKKPNISERNFFNYCKQPITVFSKGQLMIKRINLSLTVALGRLIGN